MEKLKTSYNEIVKWLEDYYRGDKNIRTYRGFEYSREFANDVRDARKKGVEFSIDPMLPIDLLVVKKQKGIDDKTRRSKRFCSYTLFWLISEDVLDLEIRLQFYQFYLSRISKVKGVEIIVVIPASAGRELEKSLRSKADETGFGLWRVDLSQGTRKEVCPPKDFRERMAGIFQKPPKLMIRFKKAIREEADGIALFFERFVREAVEAMVGIRPKQVGKRYIERRILDLVFQLKNISYAKTLSELATQHLEQKGNDYDFVSKVFARLWKECELGMDYSSFLKTCEAPLYNIFKGPYRDHYLHQFQVFVLGLNIIDKLYNRFPPDIEKQWLISSSFHDMAYPIQLYDDWAKVFFASSLGIPEIGVSDMKSHFVDKTLLACMGDIINLFCKLHFDKELKGNWLAEEEKLVSFFYKKITQEKHHCVLGSIFLLKQRNKLKRSGSTNNLFVPPALAIALHHEEVWKELSEKHRMSTLKFENDPLSFLLMFCDSAQEWGRPKGVQDAYLGTANVVEQENFILEKFEVTKTRCLVTIRAPDLPGTAPIFKRKISELGKLQEFLQQPRDIEFQITLKDKSNKITQFAMIGRQE